MGIKSWFGMVGHIRNIESYRQEKVEVYCNKHQKRDDIYAQGKEILEMLFAQHIKNPYTLVGYGERGCSIRIYDRMGLESTAEVISAIRAIHQARQYVQTHKRLQSLILISPSLPDLILDKSLQFLNEQGVIIESYISGVPYIKLQKAGIQDKGICNQRSDYAHTLLQAYSRYGIARLYKNVAFECENKL